MGYGFDGGARGLVASSSRSPSALRDRAQGEGARARSPGGSVLSQGPRLTRSGGGTGVPRIRQGQHSALRPGEPAGRRLHGQRAHPAAPRGPARRGPGRDDRPGRPLSARVRGDRTRGHDLRHRRGAGRDRGRRRRVTGRPAGRRHRQPPTPPGRRSQRPAARRHRAGPGPPRRGERRDADRPPRHDVRPRLAGRTRLPRPRTGRVAGRRRHHRGRRHRRGRARRPGGPRRARGRQRHLRRHALRRIRPRHVRCGGRCWRRPQLTGPVRRRGPRRPGAGRAGCRQRRPDRPGDGAARAGGRQRARRGRRQPLDELGQPAALPARPAHRRPEPALGGRRGRGRPERQRRRRRQGLGHLPRRGPGPADRRCAG